MLRQIRRGVFETNSSSTHSITMCLKKDYDKWEIGEMYLHDDVLVTKEEAIEELKNNKWFNERNPDFNFTDEETVDEILADYEYHTSKQYWDDEYLETFEDTYTTPSGDVVVAFGKYGHD